MMFKNKLNVMWRYIFVRVLYKRYLPIQRKFHGRLLYIRIILVLMIVLVVLTWKIFELQLNSTQSTPIGFYCSIAPSALYQNVYA